jgi:hypothetical protein
MKAAIRRRLGALVRRLLRVAPEGPREQLARQFLRGRGIEIGALSHPLWTPPEAAVTYVDRLDVPGLRRHYPELAALPLVPVDVVDDGETLKTFQPSSQDFIIANHFLEHTQDPIGTLRRFLAVLRPQGIVYMAVPDKRWTFDRDRPVTPLEHLYRDHAEGPAWSYRSHVREFAELVAGHRGEALEPAVRWIEERNMSIHFHVWTQQGLLEMLIDVRRRFSLPFDVEAVTLHRARVETIVVLRKHGPADVHG